jgi:glycosyltransferase involved in cell wall biosynthesis
MTMDDRASSAVTIVPPPGGLGNEGTGRIAVLIPCLNEAGTVAGVIGEFQRELPEAQIWVIDNGSTDGTRAAARAAGAGVLKEPRRGKGFAIRAAFQEIDADVYVLADGDGQLPAESVHELIRPVTDEQADMVVGSRALAGATSPNRINDLGNVLFSRLLRSLLAVRVTDVLSGYRALSRRLVKTLPLAARGFEIEVELTIKTSLRSYRIREIPFTVRPRPDGSASHLSVLRDGMRISWAILLLFRDYRPMAFFGILGLWLEVVALIVGVVGGTGAAVVAGLFAVAGFLSFAVGALASVLARRFQELENKIDAVTTAGLLKD